MGDSRSYEGHMDWQYNNQGPVDITSPFVQASQQSKISSFASSPSKYPGFGSNSFAQPRSESRLDSPFKPQQPPQSSFFNPKFQSQRPIAPPFRNTAFTTPQRRVEELATEFSPAESSPAATDTSEMVPLDTPEADHTNRNDDLDNATITPAMAAKKNIFASLALGGAKSSSTNHTSGRGELPRARVDFRQRDKIRKRRRQFGDRDVGSVRSRGLNHYSDESDSDWEEDDRSSSDGRRGSGSGRRRRRSGQQQGWFSSFLTAIHDHPNAPVILSWWIQFGINLFFAGLGAMVFVALGSMVMSDFRFAAAEARSKLLAEMELCTHEYTKNRCAPRSERLPALAVVCDEWEACMNQDPNKIKSLAISSKQMAITINEFFNVLSFKAWGFILSLVIVFLLANNLGFNKFRQSMNAEVRHQPLMPSQPAMPPTPRHPQLFPPPGQHDPKQAFIWAPVTPKNLRHGALFLGADATDTDDSPTGIGSELKSIMPPPPSGVEPSSRRSPSKGERDRAHSPTKHRSPSKYY